MTINVAWHEITGLACILNLVREFAEMMVQKGGQVTKPIIVVKVPCNLAVQKEKSSKDLVAYNHLATMLLPINLALFYSQAVFA